MDVLEQLVRSYARRISKDGAVALTSNGHPALVRAFAELGWSDPYIDPSLLPVEPITVSRESVNATVTDPQRAVIAPSKGRARG